MRNQLLLYKKLKNKQTHTHKQGGKQERKTPTANLCLHTYKQICIALSPPPLSVCLSLSQAHTHTRITSLPGKQMEKNTTMLSEIAPDSKNKTNHHNFSPTQNLDICMCLK